jgi:NADPH-dependent 2,4-dienoyl-CoA reductase/sulfur reductase-like enzyme/rhodanese-related sulfurtransferase
MSKHVVIVGAVALGPKAACRIKRLDPEARVTMIDKDKLISYGGCGIPYYIGGDVNDIKELRSTVYHMERNEDFFRNVKHLDVLTGKEVINVDRKEKVVTYADVDTGEHSHISYDYLVLATGSRPVVPPITGSDLPGVYAVSNLHEAQQIKDMMAKGKVDSAVVVGGGAIGLEMAEALTDMWGIETSLVEMQDQLLPTTMGPDMSHLVQSVLKENEIEVYLNTQVQEFIGDPENGVSAVKTTNGEIPCQLVILSVGNRPNSDLARQCGLSLAPHGGILVDSCMRTSDPSIFSGGDCVEVLNHLSGEYSFMPLGSLANRQGRVVGSNICGKCEQFTGVIGTFCIKVFDYGAVRAGLTVKQARDAGYDPEYALVAQSDRAHFYPTQKIMFLKLIADRKTRRVLGVEGFGGNPDAVKARVDTIASLLPHKVGLEEISNLEVSYSPPFSSAMDIANSVANALENILEGVNVPIGPDEFLDSFKKADRRVLDVRSVDDAKPFVDKYGERWINIPLHELEERASEIPQDEPLYVFCNTGVRSFEAQRYLNCMGFKDLEQVQAGAAAIYKLDDEFV